MLTRRERLHLAKVLSTEMPRRGVLLLAASQLVLRSTAAAAAPTQTTIGLGYGNYAMQRLPATEVIRICAEIGYDGVELALMPGWPTEPHRLSPSDRQELRTRLEDSGLAVPALLESLHCLRGAETHRENLDKLKRATELAYDLSPHAPPVVQSIVGGKTASWEQVKGQLVEQLEDWAAIGEQTETVICFKPHAAHAVHDVEQALWLHAQVGSKWLKTVYDYSHFYLAGLSLGDSLRQLLPITPFIQVKDSRKTAQKHEYLLPGDGQTDYRELLGILKQAGYDGFVNVEVSSMIHRKPAYRPIPTAELCYARLAPLFGQLGIERP